MKTGNYAAHAAILSANVIFGFNTPVSKTLLADGSLSSYALTCFRMLGAAAVFWLISLFIPKEPVRSKDLPLILLASLCGILINQGTFVAGLSMTSPVDASIVVTALPIVTMLLAAVFLKEPITWKKAVGVVIGASGALILILGARSHTGAGKGNLTGDLLCFLSVLSYASYLTFFKKLIARYSPVTFMKWMFLGAGLCSIPVCWPAVAAVDYASFSWDVYLRIAYVVVGATSFAYLLIVFSQRSLRPTVVSMYNYVQPVVTTLVAIAIGLDVFGWNKTLAAVLIFLGVFIVTQSKSRRQLEEEKRSA